MEKTIEKLFFSCKAPIHLIELYSFSEAFRKSLTPFYPQIAIGSFESIDMIQLYSTQIFHSSAGPFLFRRHFSF